MRVIRLMLKIALIPMVMIVTVIQWGGFFLLGVFSIVFHRIAGLFLMISVLSYLMGICTGSESIRMMLIGFVIDRVPVTGEWIVTAITALNGRIREMIRS